MHFSAKCNSGRIAIQWFHITHYLDNQYTKFQPYTFQVQKCVFCTTGDFGSSTIGCINFKLYSYIYHMMQRVLGTISCDLDPSSCDLDPSSCDLDPRSMSKVK